MFIFRDQHKRLILLLFMGIQRSVGDPVVIAADLLETTSTEEPNTKHDLPQTIYEKVEVMEHHWECIRGSDDILEKIKFTAELSCAAEDGLERITNEAFRIYRFLNDKKSLMLKLATKKFLEWTIEYDDPLKRMALIEKYSDSFIRMTIDWYNGNLKSDDFDLTLSNEAKNYLVCLLRSIERTYNDKINAYFIHQTEIYKEMTELVSLKKSLQQLAERFHGTINYAEFFEKIHDSLAYRKVFESNRHNEIWMSLLTSRRFQEGLLLIADNKSMIFEPSSWILSIKEWTDLIENEIGFYQQFIGYSDELSDHSYNFESAPKGSRLADWYSGLDEKTKSKLNNLIIRQQKYNVTCDDGKLVVRGFWIQLSYLSRMRYHNCRNFGDLKEVALLAVDTVYFDSDIRYSLRDANLFISAPKWKVFNERIISLSGSYVRGMYENSNKNDGSNGRPGPPGHNGGHFFGIGLNFSNTDQLAVKSNGGDGEWGEDGAKGLKGDEGIDAHIKFKLGDCRVESHSFPSTKGSELFCIPDNLPADGDSSLQRVDPFDVMNGSRCSATCKNNRPELQFYKVDGECGGLGGPGGEGGEGGAGGHPGVLQLVELGEPSCIKLTGENGTSRPRGEAGEPGDSGTAGRSMICAKVQVEASSYWKCQPTDLFPPTCDQHPPQQLNNQTKQYSTTGSQQPAPVSSPDFSDYLQEYAVLLKTYSNHPLYRKTIADFNDAIQRKFSTNLEGMGQLFFKKQNNIQDTYEDSNVESD